MDNTIHEQIEEFILTLQAGNTPERIDVIPLIDHILKQKEEIAPTTRTFIKNIKRNIYQLYDNDVVYQETNDEQALQINRYRFMSELQMLDTLQIYAQQRPYAQTVTAKKDDALGTLKDHAKILQTIQNYQSTSDSVSQMDNSVTQERINAEQEINRMKQAASLEQKTQPELIEEINRFIQQSEYNVESIAQMQEQLNSQNQDVAQLTDLVKTTNAIALNLIQLIEQQSADLNLLKQSVSNAEYSALEAIDETVEGYQNSNIPVHILNNFAENMTKQFEKVGHTFQSYAHQFIHNCIEIKNGCNNLTMKMMKGIHIGLEYATLGNYHKLLHALEQKAMSNDNAIAFLLDGTTMTSEELCSIQHIQDFQKEIEKGKQNALQNLQQIKCSCFQRFYHVESALFEQQAKYYTKLTNNHARIVDKYLHILQTVHTAQESVNAALYELDHKEPYKAQSFEQTYKEKYQEPICRLNNIIKNSVTYDYDYQQATQELYKLQKLMQFENHLLNVKESSKEVYDYTIGASIRKATSLIKHIEAKCLNVAQAYARMKIDDHKYQQTVTELLVENSNAKLDHIEEQISDSNNNMDLNDNMEEFENER